MSKAIAYGIKLRLYMHEKNWQQAKATAQTLMGMGYRLLDSYERVFASAAQRILISLGGKPIACGGNSTIHLSRTIPVRM